MANEHNDDPHVEPVEDRGSLVDRPQRREWSNTLAKLAVIGVMLLGCAGILTFLVRAREVSRQLRCKSNLNHLGKALLQYIGERGGGRYYPCPKGRPGVDDDYTGKEFLAMLWWTDMMPESYMFICPNSSDGNNKGVDLGVRDGQFTKDDVGGVGQQGGMPEAPRWQSGMRRHNFISYASRGWKASYLPGKTAPEERSALTDVFPSDTIFASDDTTDPPNHRSGFCVLYASGYVDFIQEPNLNVREANGAVGKTPPLDMICN